MLLGRRRAERRGRSGVYSRVETTDENRTRLVDIGFGSFLKKHVIFQRSKKTE